MFDEGLAFQSDDPLLRSLLRNASISLMSVRFKVISAVLLTIRAARGLEGTIVGDKRYGSLINPFKRLCLHARTLAFIHPFTKKHVTFSSSSQFLPSFTRFFE